MRSEVKNNSVFLLYGISDCLKCLSKHLISFWAKLSHRCKRLITVSVLVTCQRQDGHKLKSNQKKANLHYTRGIAMKCLTSGGVHLRGFAHGSTALKKKHRIAVIWQNPLSPLLHFSRKSLSFQVF